MADRTIEELDEAESLRLISAGGIGRIAYHEPVRPGRAAGELQVVRRGDRVPDRQAQRAGRGPADRDHGRRLPGGVRDRRHRHARAPGLERADPGARAPRRIRGGARERPSRRASSPGPPGSGNCSCASSRTASPAASSSRSRPRAASRWIRRGIRPRRGRSPCRSRSRTRTGRRRAADVGARCHQHSGTSVPTFGQKAKRAAWNGSFIAVMPEDGIGGDLRLKPQA